MAFVMDPLTCRSRLRTRWRRRGRWAGEVQLGRGARSIGRLEVRVIGFESWPSREQAVRELLDVGVVVLEGIVVALALDSDAILGAGKFILQAHEIFVGFQLRIVLDDEKKPAECAIELPV